MKLHAQILVVDDDLDIRQTLAEILSDEGYRIAAAANGREALDLLRAGARPALVLLDLSMPVMSGAEFRAEQLADPELAELPTVVLSASGRIEQQVAELAVNRALRKPVRLAELLAVVEEHCGEPAPG